MNKLTLDSIHAVLSARFEDGYHSLKDIPSPSKLLNADKAAKKIAEAIKSKKKITLIGDYDVDGVTSTSLVKLFFNQIPYHIDTIIPNRFSDGYGLSAKVLERVDADLIITVDNGINAIEAAQICKDREIDLIITDHHTPSEILPDAYAIVDPKLQGCTYPFKEICGAQVAWLVMGAVKKELSLDINMGNFLDLLALAIIADVMPLTNINRAMVIAGLKSMSRSKRPSSIIMNEFLNKPSISSEDIAFSIAPRLNSAGRLEDASIAFNFLTAPNENEAYRLFDYLGELNTTRKEIESDVTSEAMERVNQNDKIIVVAGEDWNEGVVGIVAARLVQKFERPAIVLSIHDGVAKGSARSVGNVSIYELIKSQKSHLLKFGGHKMAAGLSLDIENLSMFTKEINIEAEKLSSNDFELEETHLGELEVGMINFDLLNLLDSFEPYGEANKRPQFIAKDAQVLKVSQFGADKSHTKLNVKMNPLDRNSYDILAFREVIDFPESKKVTCIYTLNKNLFNNKINIQLFLNKIIEPSD